MPWTCPACGEAIRRHPNEPAPRRDTIYRCPICRLELVVDRITGKLVVLHPEPPE